MFDQIIPRYTALCNKYLEETPLNLTNRCDSKSLSGWESSNSKLMLRWFSRRVQCGRCSDFHFQNQFSQQHSGEIMNLWTIIPQMTRRVQSWRGNGASFSFSVKNLKIKAIITLKQLQPSSTLFS